MVWHGASRPRLPAPSEPIRDRQFRRDVDLARRVLVLHRLGAVEVPHDLRLAQGDDLRAGRVAAVSASGPCCSFAKGTFGTLRPSLTHQSDPVLLEGVAVHSSGKTMKRLLDGHHPSRFDLNGRIYRAPPINRMVEHFCSEFEVHRDGVLILENEHALEYPDSCVDHSYYVLFSSQ